MINRLNGVSPTDGAPDPTRPAKSDAAEKTTAAAGKPQATGPEQVDLSAEAKLAQTVARAAQASSGINGDLVQAIRKSIDSGQYMVSSTDIARAVAEVSWLFRK